MKIIDTILERMLSFGGSYGYMATDMPPIGHLIPTRYSLLSRLQNWDDEKSWKDFFDTYWRLIYSVAIKSGLTEQEAQDVVQETIICVAKDIHKFKRDQKLGSFKGWLKNLTRWRIADQLEKRGHAKYLADSPESESGETLSLEEIPDPASTGLELLWDKEWKMNLFETAVDRVKRRIKAEQYQIFYMYSVKRWPVKRVAEAFGVSTGYIYLTHHRVSTLIKKEIRILESKVP